MNNTFTCPGKCETCQYRDTHMPICWALQPGEKVVFKPHGAGCNPEAGARAVKRYFANLKAAFKELECVDLVNTVYHVRNSSNRKTGDIPTINQPAYITCARCTHCAGGCGKTGMCYAMNGLQAMYGSVKARVRNYLLYKKTPARFFDLVLADTAAYKLARWHDSGDIIDEEYLAGMVNVAKRNPGTVYLAMSKQLDIINNYCDKNGGRAAIPENLQILISTWANFDAAENKYNFPTTGVSEDC